MIILAGQYGVYSKLDAWPRKEANSQFTIHNSGLLIMIVIIGSNKGGVGKTTTAVNLATALAMKGNDICLVDADPQRSASRWYAEREVAELKPLITLIEKRDNITQTLKTLGEKFDHVIVDVAGRNSRELITGAVVADIIIAPHQCSQLDLDTLGELQDQVVRVRDLNPELKVLAYHTWLVRIPLCGRQSVRSSWSISRSSQGLNR